MLASDYPIRRLCAWLDCAPSSFYYRSQREDDTALRDELERRALQFPRYGYRRMTAELRRRECPANHKRGLRVMREAHWLVQVKHYVRTTFSRHGLGRYPNLVKTLTPRAPNEVWSAEIV